jgi:hypothetical protein
MSIPVAVLLCLFSMAFGWIFFRSPLVVLRTMARWMKFVSARLLPRMKVRSTVQEAIDWVDRPLDEPPGALKSSVAVIRSTGLMAWFVAAGNACIIALTLIQR